MTIMVFVLENNDDFFSSEQYDYANDNKEHNDADDALGENESTDGNYDYYDDKDDAGDSNEKQMLVCCH